MIKDSKYYLLKIKRWHCIAILPKSWKDLKLVSDLDRAKNKLEMLIISSTNIWINFILILMIQKDQSKM